MKNNAVVTVREDYVVKDPKEVEKILERVSRIIGSSYIRMQKENRESGKAGSV